MIQLESSHLDGLVGSQKNQTFQALLFSFQRSKDLKILAAMWGAILMAILANFTSFYLVPAFFLVSGWLGWHAEKKYQVFVISSAAVMLIASVVLPPIFRLMEANTLFGPKESFFVSTLYSLSWLVLQFGWFIKGKICMSQADASSVFNSL